MVELNPLPPLQPGLETQPQDPQPAAKGLRQGQAYQGQGENQGLQEGASLRALGPGTQMWDGVAGDPGGEPGQDQTRSRLPLLPPTRPETLTQTTAGHWAYMRGQADLAITCPSLGKEVPLRYLPSPWL